MGDHWGYRPNGIPVRGRVTGQGQIKGGNMAIRICENGHRACTFDASMGYCPVCQVLDKENELKLRITFLDNEIDHLYVMVFNYQSKLKEGK